MRFASVVLAALAAGGCTWPGTLEVYVPEIRARATHRLDLGRDLGLLVALRIPLDRDNDEYRTPENLRSDPVDESGVTIEDLGKIGFGSDAWATIDREGEGRLLRITPRRSGLGTIRFTADDAENQVDFDWNAWSVARVEYTSRIAPDGVNEMDAVVDRISVFAGNTIDVRARYFVETLELRGVAPLMVSAPAAGTRFLEPSEDDPTRPPLLQLDDMPHTATVSSPAGGTTLAIDAVADEAIATIRLAAGNDVLAPGTTYRLVRGRIEYVRALPFDARGSHIEGSADGDPTGSVTGESIVIRDTISGGRLQLEAVTTGTSTLEITWGSATATATIEVIEY